MPLIPRDKTTRINLPADGEWIEVKERLSRGDRITVEKATVGGATFNARSGVGGISDVSAGDALEAAEFAMLELVLRAWSFDVPITSESIRDLDEASMDAIKIALNELYAPRSEDDRKNLSGSGAAPSSAAAPLRAISNG